LVVVVCADTSPALSVLFICTSPLSFNLAFVLHFGISPAPDSTRGWRPAFRYRLWMPSVTPHDTLLSFHAFSLQRNFRVIISAS
jgi:hypothetical protein